MKYAYPAIFEPDEDKIAVSFPDIECCFTFGDDMADAILMGEDVLAMTLAYFEDEGKPIPPPSKISDISTPHTVSFVRADTDAWRKEVDDAAVRKNCTIPNWLNKKAEKAGVNFSQVLQDALKKLLNVSEPKFATA